VRAATSSQGPNRHWNSCPLSLAAALAVCAIALVACGSGAKPSSSRSAGTQALTYADCMRANGLPHFPDPGSNGALPNPALPAFQAALKACAKLQPVGIDLGGPPEPSAAELRAALAFARCMRAHGFSHFPDPLTTVSDVATLTLGPGEYFPDPGPTEVQSPGFRQAAKACGVQLPSSPPPSSNSTPPS
jgi:hypothetical protein